MSYDTVTVRWAGGEVEVGTPAAENSREAFIEESSLTTLEQAVEYGTQWLAGNETVDQSDIGIIGKTLKPWDGIGKGDAIRVRNRLDVVETARVHGVGFTGIRRNGMPNWTVTVGTATQERAVRNTEQLTRLTQGSMKGSFPAAAPSPAPSFGDLPTGALPIINLPVADTDSLSTTPPLDRTKPYPFVEAAAIIRFQCAAESLVGSTDTEFQLYRITYSAGSPTDTLLETFTWPGTARRYQALCEHLFSPNESYQLRISQAGSHNLLTIQPIGSSAN